MLQDIILALWLVPYSIKPTPLQTTAVDLLHALLLLFVHPLPLPWAAVRFVRCWLSFPYYSWFWRPALTAAHTFSWTVLSWAIYSS